MNWFVFSFYGRCAKQNKKLSVVVGFFFHTYFEHWKLLSMFPISRNEPWHNNIDQSFNGARRRKIESLIIFILFCFCRQLCFGYKKKCNFLLFVRSFGVVVQQTDKDRKNARKLIWYALHMECKHLIFYLQWQTFIFLFFLFLIDFNRAEEMDECFTDFFWSISRN